MPSRLEAGAETRSASPLGEGKLPLDPERQTYQAAVLLGMLRVPVDMPKRARSVSDLS